MGLGTWPLARVEATLGLGPWIGSGGATSPEATGSTLNLLPGYVVRTSRAYASVNGTPFELAGAQPVLTDEGFYTVDVSDAPTIAGATRYEICIVDPTKLAAGARAPTSGEPPIFTAMVNSLAASYPRGKIAAGSVELDYSMLISSNRAVSLEIRKLDPTGTGTYVKIGEALIVLPGTWRSSPFALASNEVSDIKLAVVFGPQNVVLA